MTLLQKTSLRSVLLFLLAFGMMTSRPRCHAQKSDIAHPSGASWTSPVNPIIPGDHPDPTILRVNRRYWTTSTSGDWAPVFPLYRSDDLRGWTAAGAVFPKAPEWASGSFWAPELVQDNGHVFVYYVGRKRGGPLCVAVATADRPEGPYTDHGPLICQSDGSIDPAMARDESGRPFLIWKEDGNSIRKPTSIWAQPLSTDLLHLVGTRTQLIANEPATWEGGVVEAPYVLRHAGMFYLFYAGNACCGTECHYAEGVARAPRLLGPWTKDPANPIIRPNQAWRCPGHGTAVETPSGVDYFIYHAYPSSGTVYLGRESVLDRITWTDGWPVVDGGKGPSGGQGQPLEVVDWFEANRLSTEWKWPVGHAPHWRLTPGELRIDASDSSSPAFLARTLLGPDYIARVAVKTGGNLTGGLGVIGGARSGIVLSVQQGHLQLWRWNGSDRKTVWEKDLAAGPTLWLEVSSAGLGHAVFRYSVDGQHWHEAGETMSVTDLLPWDEGLRIGLVAAGQAGSCAEFVHFSLSPTSALPSSAAR